MSLPIPNNREQIYLSKIINKDLENIPMPLSRLEMYFKCLLDGDVSKLPAPMSRKELILHSYILDVECDVVPANRTEVFFKALKSIEVEGLPTPQSKLEVFLDYIIRNGCLEKYEYYPFTIRDYLNVKNTPKAKMKFKGAKGNTLILNPSGEIVLPGTSGAIIKSFGEPENKIEVLSDNNLQGELNQSSKATLMYRNSSNELVPIPILRGKWDGDRFLWGDELLEHGDGDIYYHNRCNKLVINGSESWTPNSNVTPSYLTFKFPISGILPNNSDLISDKFLNVKSIDSSKDIELIKVGNSTDLLYININPTKLETPDVAGFKKWLQANNVTVVYQLAEEEIYPCELSEQLYSHEDQTNIFINGGGVVGETTIEIGTKLGPIVDSIRQNVDRSTRAIEGLVSYGVQECAYQLYPEDFENVPNVVEGEKNA